MALMSIAFAHKCNFGSATLTLLRGRIYQEFYASRPLSLSRIHLSHNSSKLNTNYCRSTSSAHHSIPVPPPPTWSISELRLISGEDETEEKLSEEELATLARRCLIDVRRLSPERRDQLRTDVAGIMRCASVLLDVKDLDVRCDGSTHDELSGEAIYDAPRGLTKIPIRRDERSDEDSGNDRSDNGARTWGDARESRSVLQSGSVQRKMVKVGEDNFFSVATKEVKDNNS